MKPRSVFIFLSAVTLLRLAWLAIQGVSAQEAYYWMCGSKMAAAFFDGPPGTAFLVRMIGAVTGDSREILRLAWPLFGFIAAWLAWLLARTLYNDLVAGCTLVGLNALPFFNELCVTVGPGIPLMILTLAGMLAAYSAVEGRRLDWILSAALLALACLFRYEAVLVTLGLLIAVLSVLRKKEKPDALAAASLILLPAAALWSPLAWNAALDWIPIAGGTFQTWWRPQPGGWTRDLVEYFRQFSFAAGIAMAGALVGLLWTAWHKQGPSRFLLVTAGPASLWALYQFLIGRDFSTAAWIAVVPLLMFLAETGSRWRWMGIFSSAIVLIALVSSGLLLHEEGLQRAVGKTLAVEMHAASREMPASEGGGFLIAEDADLASLLTIYFKPVAPSEYPPVFVPESPALTSQFGIWPSYGNFIETDKATDEFFTEQKGYNPFIGRHALYMGAELPQTVKGAFSEVRPLRDIKLPDGKSMIIYLCLDYQTLPL
ncbi:MAG: glycosyltransferase family 39 protein [Verrucomicrobia bacterium]|nr:glycosyltransferase family 39 protein [Verrucomicrobiota bacterium]